MDKIEKRGVVGVGVGGGCKQPETTTDLFLKWGNKKRLRCVRMRDSDDAADDPSYAVSGRRRIRRRINSRFVSFPSDNNNNNNKAPSHPPPCTRLTRNSETGVHLRSDNNRKSSPEKEVYTTRGASAAVSMAEKPSVSPVDGGGGGGGGDQKVKHVWPKLFITLSNKEKEEDFMAMKGCKPPHRPKKRPKIIQRSLLLVSPGGWLTDVCQERYEVIEKKSTKKRPTGLKYMGSSMDSDSE
ncbi:uncharacterized protein LOC112501518 isoform X1 [Cynara cardunculus var. scolymus]|uniref:Uncharacterized protein n=1 Tax=Cynara cardunculus var. scolymus TaxID=59895 RepID=A0A103XDZ2_CYNCS|nr:uncharacterized protein LOC112501518 isoform X1 [Cynara cardunculus var. scolymus]KVH88904.1 Protein of unknown function DUF1639 [Cynara cardunculus var. scolymus]